MLTNDNRKIKTLPQLNGRNWIRVVANVINIVIIVAVILSIGLVIILRVDILLCHRNRKPKSVRHKGVIHVVRN